MTYPTEAFVRLVLQHELREGFQGIVLDHGCGSGVNTEFLVRRGHKVHCTEISERALNVVRKRFGYKNLPLPAMSHIDPNKSLTSQMPSYDHVVAWCSLLYNTPKIVKQNIIDLIAKLPPFGCFMCAFPTPDDLLASSTELLSDGSRRIIEEISGQEGMVITLPETENEFVSWFYNLDIRDVGKYTITLGGQQSEHFVIYGVKPT